MKFFDKVSLASAVVLVGFVYVATKQPKGNPIELRCTEAVLRSFGVFGVCPKHGTGVVHALTDAGYRVRALDERPMTLRAFVKKHPKGAYYLTTSGHAMSLIDGSLTDTTGRGVDERRVLVALEISRRANPIADDLALQRAVNKLWAPLVNWIHSPSRGKSEVLSAYSQLSAREKAALDSDVAAAFQRVYRSDSIIAYRYRDSKIGGASLSDVEPRYLASNQYAAYRVHASDVLAFWGQKELPLGNKSFAHEHEIILKPNAKPACANPIRGGGIVIRERYKQRTSFASTYDDFANKTRSGHFYRGIEEAEWKFIHARGFIRSNQQWCVPGEGTCFANDIASAESYVDSGSTDPLKTGRPNYLIEVKSDALKQDPRDGYFKTTLEVPKSTITRAWELVPEGDEIVAYAVASR
jgi:hypothetical protein